MKVGITEQGDAGIDFSWLKKHNQMDFSILITKCVNNSRFFDEVLMHPNTIVHATITGLGKEIEPNVDSWERTVKGLKLLIEKIGYERCVLRIDPIIPGYNSQYLSNVYNILNSMKGYIKRVRFSFIDNYKHIQARGLNLSWNTFNPPNKFQWIFYNSLFAYKNDFEFEVCAENVYGYTWIEQIGCISEKDFKVFGIVPDKSNYKKQRPLCKCLAYKTELLNKKEQCSNKCLYCYWR
jgi:hypothetical protein